ncbi:MAG: HINT domain-containing protein, partial [Acetatifactor sp.]|nr:HINT domain-containing protein [Acetatifactor sp.]
AGEKVRLLNGGTGEVEAVTVEHLDEPVKVYNFEVEDWHTYYVAELGVLVHNKGCGSTRRQAFRKAKEAAGIPKSAQHKRHKFVYDGTTENRIVYEFEVNRQSKYIIEHDFDKYGRGKHFHGADASMGSPFDKGTYNQYNGHFPEDFLGFD